ncbi:hypothetical protein RAH32_20470 [Paracoccus sp. WLY502]|uniref:hypothetical protein n=1 Tax=Paracoccus yibinensis TaxID=3068891 RepID=UPI0027966426|nr:hypothetical protein [Paracoccus sp. WLY502]MDQ1902797.1 hypothetical protein [Paracoccus sp. WLY502]
MSDRITRYEDLPATSTYHALKGHLSDTATTLMLCHANLDRMDLSAQERGDTLWRIERQIAELNAMRLKIIRPRRNAFSVMVDKHLGAMSAAKE